MDELAVIARVALALVFVTSALTKAVSLGDTRRAVEAFRVPAALVSPVTLALPVAELFTAVLLLGGGATATAGLASAIGLLLAFTAVVALALRRGDAVDCQCFGALTPSSQISVRTVARNGGLLLLAGVAATANRRWSLYGWLQAQDASAILTLLALITILLAVVSLALWCRALFLQQGRMLARIDQLEAAHAHAHGPVLAPDFSLVDLDDVRQSLSGFLRDERPVLLTFMTPGCAPCGELLPELATWSQGFAEELRVVGVVRGDTAQARAKYGEAGFPVLLDEDGAVTQAYDGMTTPAGVLVHGSGAIMGGPALGAAAIRDLVRVPAGERWAKVQPAHLRPPVAGEPLPSGMQVLQADGQVVPLLDLIEARTLVMMWSPTCSFAARVEADLRDLMRRSEELGIDVLVVNHGELSELTELTFPPHVRTRASPGGAVGHVLGVAGTPVALLIDADGDLLSDPAEGTEEVAHLLAQVQTSAPAVG